MTYDDHVSVRYVCQYEFCSSLLVMLLLFSFVEHNLCVAPIRYNDQMQIYVIRLIILKCMLYHFINVSMYGVAREGIRKQKQNKQKKLKV